jgi:putative transposase
LALEPFVAQLANKPSMNGQEHHSTFWNTPPEQVTTDGHTSYPRAVRETLGDGVLHRTNKYLNTRLEQDHRGVKQRYYPMHGFGNFAAAARFCSAFEELRNYLRPHSTMGNQPRFQSKDKLSLIELLP